MEWRNHEVTWPHITVPVTELLNVIIKRINEASVRFELSTCADLRKPLQKGLVTECIEIQRVRTASKLSETNITAQNIKKI